MAYAPHEIAVLASNLAAMVPLIGWMIKTNADRFVFGVVFEAILISGALVKPRINRKYGSSE
ncbi:MAG: hypothetical protein GF363_15070 [Chitinivibrionales bacterium]|nr:hypothetical protein [Chitinivibrionales bacterium]